FGMLSPAKGSKKYRSTRLACSLSVRTTCRRLHRESLSWKKLRWCGCTADRASPQAAAPVSSEEASSRLAVHGRVAGASMSSWHDRPVHDGDLTVLLSSCTIS